MVHQVGEPHQLRVVQEPVKVLQSMPFGIQPSFLTNGHQDGEDGVTRVHLGVDGVSGGTEDTQGPGGHLGWTVTQSCLQR